MPYRLFITTLIPLLLAACATTSGSIMGKYVSDGYAQRGQGYDWVAVTVTPTTLPKRIHVHVHSRSDIKKPTCSLNTTATVNTASQYLAHVKNIAIVFDFIDDKLTISAGKNTHHHDLMYFCSGGGSLSGEYKRLP